MVAPLAVLASFYLMLNLPAATWLRFAIWMAIGFVVYFLYGQRNSRLNTGRPEGIDPRDRFLRDRDAAEGRA